VGSTRIGAPLMQGCLGDGELEDMGGHLRKFTSGKRLHHLGEAGRVGVEAGLVRQVEPDHR
jgi:hypothetical protein